MLNRLASACWVGTLANVLTAEADVVGMPIGSACRCNRRSDQAYAGREPILWVARSSVTRKCLNGPDAENESKHESGFKRKPELSLTCCLPWR